MTTLITPLLALLWIIVLPNIASSILVITDNILVRAAMLALVLFGLTLGPVEGGILFFAVCLTFLERNRRKIASVSTRLGNDGINQTPTFLERLLSKIGAGPRYDEEQVSENNFVPKDELGSNTFINGPEGSITEQKRVLDSQPLGTRAENIYDRLL